MQDFTGWMTSIVKTLKIHVHKSTLIETGLKFKETANKFKTHPVITILLQTTCHSRQSNKKLFDNYLRTLTRTYGMFKKLYKTEVKEHNIR